MCFPYITTKYIITCFGGLYYDLLVPFIAHIKF